VKDIYGAEEVRERSQPYQYLAAYHKSTFFLLLFFIAIPADV